MRAQFFCDSCNARVPFNAERCPTCGKHFTAVKCPECAYEGKPREFAQGCPVCGYLTDLGNAQREGPATREGKTSRLSRRFVTIATVVLLVALGVLVVVLVSL